MEEGTSVQSLRLVVRGFLANNGKVLVIQRGAEEAKLPLYYELPGGRVDPGEKPEHAVEREFKEEAGLSVTAGRPYRVFSFVDEGGVQVVEIVYVVRLQAEDEAVQLESGFQGFTWVDTDTMETLKILDDMKESIKEGFQACAGDHGQPLEVPGMGANIVKLSEAIPLLRSGQVGILPTDTLYGVVGSVYNFETIERIYAVRKRTASKPFIILIADVEDLAKFGIEPDEATINILMEYWPGPVTFILPCSENKYRFLHRGKESLAFRVPDNPALRVALKQTGPLVAPSANMESQPPATTIEEAQKYFGASVDFYVDGGELNSKPSTVVTVRDGNLEIVREGAIDIHQLS